MDVKANKIRKTVKNSLEHIYTSLLKVRVWRSCDHAAWWIS